MATPEGVIVASVETAEWSPMRGRVAVILSVANVVTIKIFVEGLERSRGCLISAVACSSGVASG